jgi:ribosomal protein S18 acetylase RimI-like enzyme
MHSSSVSSPDLTIRNIYLKDVTAVVMLQRESFPDLTTGLISAPKFLENHISIFPEGQFCAELDGKIIASATSLIVSLKSEYAQHTWHEIVGNENFTNHDPNGDSLYADDLSTHPSFRRLGIGTALLNARKGLTRKLNLKRIIGGGRLFNYCEFSAKMSPDEYAEKVVEGELQDPVLSFQLKNGFRYIKIIPNYLYDSRSLNYATFIEWINTDYRQH